MTYTHARLLEVIIETQPITGSVVGDTKMWEHLTGLRSTVERHRPYMGDPKRGCAVCGVGARYEVSARRVFGPVAQHEFWPCADIQQVADQLTSWGLLCR